MYGVGTSLVTGSGAPTAGMVYKLVEVDGRPVAKRSEHKATQGGRKTAVRRHRATGTATEEVLVSRGRPELGPHDRLLQVPLMRGGKRVDGRRDRRWARPAARLRRRAASVPWEGLKLSAGRARPCRPCCWVPERSRSDRVPARGIVGGRAERLHRGRLARRRRRRRGGAAISAPASPRRGYDHVVATRDHHIDPGAHFAATPDYVDTWPAHCVVGTGGVELHPDLDRSLLEAVFDKGEHAAAYSGFEGRGAGGIGLADWLRGRRGGRGRGDGPRDRPLRGGDRAGRGRGRGSRPPCGST